MIVFLENNHGKWLADMLFGQLQTRRKNTTILGIDGLLKEFEAVNRRGGSVQGFAINSLSTVDFSAVLRSLGYATKPPKDFGFTKRNIHFATACAPNAANRLPEKLRALLSDLLPEDPGMVRLCRQPPGKTPNNSLPFENRYIDVPAADLGVIAPVLQRGIELPCSFPNTSPLSAEEAPLVVSLQQGYAKSGNCVVSSRNTEHVGYNGIRFRKMKAYPELLNDASSLVKEAWPPGLLRAGRVDHSVPSSNAEYGAESQKCAPENWVLRRPVSHFRTTDGEAVARYPPRNMLNAEYGRPPRDPFCWKPSPTYAEPPVPVQPNTCAHSALSELATSNLSLESSLSVLDVLKAIYKHMNDRHDVCDPWLQKGVTIPSREAIEKYEANCDIYRERERGHPSPPITVLKAFKVDRTVNQEVESRLRYQDGNGGSRPSTRSSILKKLFEEYSAIPGKLDRFEVVVEKDLERFAREVKHFKEVVQKQFDETHGI